MSIEVNNFELLQPAEKALTIYWVKLKFLLKSFKLHSIQIAKLLRFSSEKFAIKFQFDQNEIAISKSEFTQKWQS